MGEEGKTMASGRPRFTDTVIRTGTEHCTITEAHPYHQPIGRTDPKGAGVYIRAYDPRCPLCREDGEKNVPGR
jgi:hypothetical protein